MTQTDPTAQPSSADTGKNAFLLVGMHRSGTSLAASILHAGGVNMGRRLMGASHGNPRGHFENLDFFEFHRDILQHHGHGHAGWVSQGALDVPDTFLPRARELIYSNSSAAGPGGWGWKDPRTVLFLDYWRRLLPEARFVCIYRSPWEVAESVFRRGDDNDQAFQGDPADIIRVWMHYNRCLLDFLRRHPDQCVLVSNDAVCAAPAAFVRLVNERFGASLTPPDPAIVDPTIMHRRVSTSTRVQLVFHTFPETLPLLRELHEHCNLRSPQLDPAQLQHLAESSDLSDSYRDWFLSFQAHRDSANLQRQLADLRSSYDRDTADLHRHLADLRTSYDHDTAYLRRQLDNLRSSYDRDTLALSNHAAATHRECLKAINAHATSLACIEALCRAVAVLNFPAPPPVLVTRDHLIPVRADPPEAARVAPVRTAFVAAGPFPPGDYRIVCRVRPDALPASVTLFVPWFLDSAPSQSCTLTLSPDAAPSTTSLHLDHPAPILTLLLPSNYPVEGMDLFEIHRIPPAKLL